jgi:D-3-phosphoglycerate dehydrogenase
VYGSTLKNVDLRAAAEMNIQVRNVSNYCDGETVELLLTEVLMMARNIGPISWKEKPTSLFGKRLGIIGMGGTGHALARLASGIGMNVSYFSPTRSTVADQAGYRYMSKADLLGQSDIISLHVPPFVPALGADDFKLITSGSILMSSCQGRVWDRDRLMGWLADSANRLILDGFAFSQLPATDQEELRLCSQVRISPVWAYLTTESLQRIADLFLAQFLDFGKQCTASV